MTRPSALDLNGEPPSLAALRCEAFISQAFVYEGEVVETANALHMQFGCAWHRLSFDWGIIFWRLSNEDPRFSQNEDEECIYQLTDIGKSLSLIGKRLDHYAMESVETRATVTFVFEGGPTIVVENFDDNTNYRVVFS